jgi:phenylacetic acid degradation operon negative regulatory protein
MRQAGSVSRRGSAAGGAAARKTARAKRTAAAAPDERDAATPAPDPAIARWIARTLCGDPPRARSLIVTVWGDALAPHGGEIWLSALIRLLAPFGINERLARTSVFRLARDGWIEARSHGRQSRYRLTAAGRLRFEAAYRRIYAPPVEAWSGEWEIVTALPHGSDGGERQRLRDELRWEGYGTLLPGVFVRPHVGGGAAPAAEDADRVVLLAREIGADDDATPLARSTARLWDLADIAAGYRRFLALFGAVIERFRMRDIAQADPAQCFVVRTLLIHAFRRVLLRDPRLPPVLLPLDWPGAAAYALTRDFYRLALARAEAHLAATVAVNGSRLPPPEPSFHARFGGLASAPCTIR